MQPQSLHTRPPPTPRPPDAHRERNVNSLDIWLTWVVVAAFPLNGPFRGHVSHVNCVCCNSPYEEGVDFVTEGGDAFNVPSAEGHPVSFSVKVAPVRFPDTRFHIHWHQAITMVTVSG